MWPLPYTTVHDAYMRCMHAYIYILYRNMHSSPRFAHTYACRPISHTYPAEVIAVLLDRDHPRPTLLFVLDANVYLPVKQMAMPGRKQYHRHKQLEHMKRIYRDSSVTSKLKNKLSWSCYTRALCYITLQLERK